MQRFGILFGSGVVAAMAVSANAATLYDSGGFEAGAGFSSGLAGTGMNLVGQSAGSVNPATWGQDSGTAATVSATVGAFVGPTPPNYQYVQVRGVGTGSDAGYYYPTNYTGGLPYNATGQQIAVRWTMTTSTGAVGDPFFGIDAYGSGGTELARFGVDATSGALVANDTTIAGVTSTPGTYYQYELLLNYANHTYAAYVAPADGVSTFGSPVATGSLYDTTATTFTDADLATFSLTGSTFAGIAVVDNYSVVATVPEPMSLGAAGVALGLLGRRRRAR